MSFRVGADEGLTGGIFELIKLDLRVDVTREGDDIV